MPKKIYYGWWIVFASFWTLFVCAGIGFSTLAVFLKFIEQDTSWDRYVLSIAGGISALAALFCAPLVGYVIDRFGPRVAMIPGAVILSLSFLLLGGVETKYQLYMLYFGVGIGMAATTILPAQTLVSRWFDRKRGRAMGLISVAIGLGTVIWIPVSTHLVEEFGWRSAYRILGVAIAVVSLPLIVFIVRASPATLGLAVEGGNDSPNENGSRDADDAAAPGETGLLLKEAFRTPSFWFIACATFFVAVPSSGFGLHLIAFLRDLDMSATRAGLVWSFTMGVSIVGRFFFGWISEQYQKRYFAAVANSIRALTLLILVLFALNMVPVAVAVVQLALLYGLGNGCNAVMNPLIVGETFGVKSFGKIMGVLGVPFTAGMALGQVAGGRLYVMTGNYNAVFAIFAILFICAGISISFARPLFLDKTRVAFEQDTG